MPFSIVMKSRLEKLLKPLQTYPWLLSALLILAFFALYILNIDNIHMRPDEELSFRNTSRFGLVDTINWMGQKNNQPPLWWANFWVWWRMMGTSEFANRLNSIFYSLLTLSLLYQIGKRWFGGARFGWFALVALGVNSFFFVYTLEMRAYAMGIFFVAISLWFFQRWLQDKTWRSAVFFGLSLAASIYIHYYLVFFIAVLVIFFLIFYGFNLRLLKQGVFAGLLAAVLFLPWVPALNAQLVRMQNPDMDEDRDIPAPTMPTNDETVELLWETATNDQVLIYQAILILGVVFLWRKKWYWLAILVAIGFPALVLIINLQVEIFTLRYVAFLSVALALAVGAALASIPTPIKWAALVGFVVISVAALPDFIPIRIPYRDLYRELSALGHPDDVLYFDEFDYGGFDLWQINQYIDPTISDGIQRDFDDASQAERLWFITPKWEESRNPEVRERFNSLLDTHRVEYALGQCTVEWCFALTYLRQPPLAEPIEFFGEDDTILFRGADVTVGETSVDVRLWWVEEEQLSHDYSITLFVVGPDGLPVAQVDGSVMDKDWGEIPMSQLEPDTIYIDERTLPLPETLASGEYEVWLVLYQWWDNTRAKLVDNSTHLLLHTFAVGDS